jgi:predicted choloylglycine hydrolase
MANCKIQQFSGSHTEIGYAIGKSVKGRLDHIINDHVQMINSINPIDFDKFFTDGLIWFNKLPGVYQDELSAIADGSECKLEKIILWCFCDKFFLSGCTSFVCTVNNVPWVGRNNDYAGPGKWNFINILKADGKIPVMLFGLEAGIFSGTGFNDEKIWLHYNWLPSWDNPTLGESSLPSYVFIRQALETCSSVRELEQFLSLCIRDTGMALTVIDGKTNESNVYECTCNKFTKRKSETGFTVSANHHNEFSYPEGSQYLDDSSICRQKRVEELLMEDMDGNVVNHFAKILSDPIVEQNETVSGTVYSVIACPSLNKIWYAAGGFPSASNGGWEDVKWL